MSTSSRDPDDKGGGFTVSDRRAFTETGESRPESSETKPASKTPPPPASRDGRVLPPVDFHTFIISLGSSALLHLGEIERPEGGATKDLVMAKHTIDLLEMLHGKTKGNLTSNEEKLLESLLYDLRLRYIEAAKT